MKTVLSILPIIFILNTGGVCQNQLEMAGFNILSNGVTTGLASLINKPKSKRLFPYLTKSFAYGCIGGAVIYGAKESGNLIVSEENLAYGHLSKVIFCIGSSINYNIARGMKPWEEFNYFFGFLEFSYNFKQHRFRAMLNPYSLVRFAVLLARPELRFSASKTIESGQFFFWEEYKPNSQVNLIGYNVADCIVVTDAVNFWRQFGNRNYISTPAHESVHVFQSRELLVFNKAISHRIGIGNFWIQNDLRLFDASYELEKKYYETEAEFFSRIK